MIVRSFVKNDEQLQPIEVEVALIPGLPQIHIVGLPDRSIKESVVRIKSALRAQGFELPKSKQIIVNLRPNHLKKTSIGLDLAMAAGILWETGQMPKPLEGGEYFVYGELDLEGKISAPEDMGQLHLKSSHQILSGFPNNDILPMAQVLAARELKEIAAPQLISQQNNLRAERPLVNLQMELPASYAEKLMVLALGQHSCLLAGPAGSGKTTGVKLVHGLLPDPNSEQLWSLKQRGVGLFWPLVQPHHSLTLAGLIGGGAQLYGGDLQRADGGVLALDEYLEFSTRVVEALREPMEDGTLRLARSGRLREDEISLMVLATTNLCPCGDFVPGRPVSCRFSLKKCRSYSEKLSGPMLDRFQSLIFTFHQREANKLAVSKMLTELADARLFIEQSRGLKAIPNAKLGLEVLIGQLKGELAHRNINGLPGSHRRKLSTLRVARSFADLAQSEIIKNEHLEQAFEMTFKPYEALRRWD